MARRLDAFEENLNILFPAGSDVSISPCFNPDVNCTRRHLVSEILVLHDFIDVVKDLSQVLHFVLYSVMRLHLADDLWQVLLEYERKAHVFEIEVWNVEFQLLLFFFDYVEVELGHQVVALLDQPEALEPIQLLTSCSWHIPIKRYFEQLLQLNRSFQNPSLLELI